MRLYRTTIDKNQKFSLDVSGVPVEEALRILFKNSNYDFEYKDQRILIVLKSIPQTEAKKGEHTSEKIDIVAYDKRGFTFGFTTGII